MRAKPTHETEEQRRVIAPSRSIGLPAVLRLRQRFFVKKGLRARYHPIVSRAHMRARRSTPNSGSREWKTARSANRRAMQRGDSKRSAFRVESRENRSWKINDARASASASCDSLPLPPANDSRVINRSGGESFSVEKYRISRVCDARYPVITKFPTTVFQRWYVCNREWHPRKQSVSIIYRFFHYSLLSIIESYCDKTN